MHATAALSPASTAAARSSGGCSCSRPSDPPTAVEAEPAAPVRPDPADDGQFLNSVGFTGVRNDSTSELVAHRRGGARSARGSSRRARSTASTGPGARRPADRLRAGRRRAAPRARPATAPTRSAAEQCALDSHWPT
ncbi:hypothetical protein HBB16_12195 [Pseudonocardia sp. MCCB 268]|nr:hypothetical protein [Pseudonocardia cytotoxica]